MLFFMKIRIKSILKKDCKKILKKSKRKLKKNYSESIFSKLSISDLNL